ncbi:MAG: Anthranilate phosphoribosyltransferase [uncultured Thermomicrobiales bacterium]|uniref:Anthranilate phosphoribosyltransferase n=1 Tax=uncultured Thermomicrobiales bacterium TaxID=1645740 RepID=A0A6J4VBC3_9BACT|nr:MAG: Anthranilate phosphoribosyltransferase [uncultured Thermomicrobiales bacterium]
MAVAAVSRSDIKQAIRGVVDGRELTLDEAAAAMDAVMGGGVADAQIAALVTALRMRGETVEEIAGFAETMRRHALRVEVAPGLGPLVDTCGTGGDASGTFNISTTASFAIAGAGVRVAKHGNRAVTSRCGSADLLEGLGVAVELTPAAVARCIEEVGIGFMYAPAFHPAMRFVGPTRREIGIRTIFNILGPLTNPAGAGHQLIGVGHPEIARKLARVLARLGSERAVLVHAAEGLDEIGIAGPTTVTEYDARHGEIRVFQITPEEFGLGRATVEDLRGGDVAANVAITRAVLSGEPGPRRAVTLLNAGAGIYAADAAASVAEGVELAATAIDSGAALATLTRLADLSSDLAASASVTP